jgi:hypothetical protein
VPRLARGLQTWSVSESMGRKNHHARNRHLMDITTTLLISLDCFPLRLFAARDPSGYTNLPHHCARHRPWLCHLDSSEHESPSIRLRSGTPTPSTTYTHSNCQQHNTRQHGIQSDAMTTGSANRRQQVSDFILDCPMPSQNHAPPPLVTLRTIASHLLVPD